MKTPPAVGSWREVAWNGVRFEAPADWLPARIGARYLLLEDAGGPALEIRWEPVRGKFSHAAQLKRLAAGGNRRSSPTPVATDPPPSWAAALKRFEASGFTWGSERWGAQGAILYCRQCRQASLVQLFQRGTPRPPADAVRILSSLRDHTSEEDLPWAIFEIRARIPSRYRLTRHRFAAGLYELAFESDGQRLWLHRWAPAATLLANCDLTAFARQRIGFPGGAPVVSRWAGCAAAEWLDAPPAAGGRRWWARFKAKHPYKWLRLWHLEDANRILAVRVESRRGTAPEVLDRLCATYEVV